MKAGLSFHERVKPTSPVQGWPMEERPYAQNTQVSVLWQAFLSAGEEADRQRPFRALLAAGGRDRGDARATEPPADRGRAGGTPHAAGDPYAVRLWANEEFCAKPQKLAAGEKPVEFRKITQLAADMLQTVRLPSRGRGIVLFDAYYLCPTITRACDAVGFPFIGVAKKNRNFAPDGRDRDQRKVGRYGANVLHKEGRPQPLNGQRYRLAERVGRLSKLGRVKLVFSRRVRESSWIAMATNHVQWGKKTVLTHYSKRWGIEVLWKMSKQYLGLGDYQVLRYRAVERYLHLVLIAHLLLTHLAIHAPDAQAELQTTHQDLRLPSIPQLQETLRVTLWQDVIQSLEKGSKNRTLARKIKEFVQL